MRLCRLRNPAELNEATLFAGRRSAKICALGLQSNRVHSIGKEAAPGAGQHSSPESAPERSAFLSAGPRDSNAAIRRSGPASQQKAALQALQGDCWLNADGGGVPFLPLKFPPKVRRQRLVWLSMQPREWRSRAGPPERAESRTSSPRRRSRSNAARRLCRAALRPNAGTHAFVDAARRNVPAYPPANAVRQKLRFARLQVSCRRCRRRVSQRRSVRGVAIFPKKFVDNDLFWPSMRVAPRIRSLNPQSRAESCASGSRR
jgi:hypothetical protein